MGFFVGRRVLPFEETTMPGSLTMLIPLSVAAVLLVTAVLPRTVMARDLPPVIESRSIGNNAGFNQAVNPNVNPNVNLAQPPAKTVEARLARLERLLEGRALIEMQMRIDDLQKDIQDLLGLSEVQTHTLEGIKKRQRDLYLDIDRRLRQLVETSPTAPPTGLTPQQGGRHSMGVGTANPAMHQGQINGSVGFTPKPAMSANAAVDSGNTAVNTAPAAVSDAAARKEEQAYYQQAFDILKEARYEDSIAAFKNFIDRFPQGLYSGNAQYWIGEANYVMRRFDVAIKEFNTVLSLFPDSAKIPDAMLKIGYSYYETKNWPSSRSALESLVQRYPATTAAQLAKNRLLRMKVEGR